MPFGIEFGSITAIFDMVCSDCCGKDFRRTAEEGDRRLKTLAFQRDKSINLRSKKNQQK